MTDHDTVSVDTLKALLEAFNQHDLDQIMTYFADDCVLYMPRGPEPWGRRLVGRDAVRDGLATVQAGAGVVADSDPRTELAESKAKMSALMPAIGGAQ